MTHHAQLDPIMVALIDRLPAADEPFTTGDRERWVAAMDAALQFLYPPEWAPEARKRLRGHLAQQVAEERAKAGVTIAGVSAPEVAEALRTAKAKRDAADHFPTIEAPPGGIILAGPLREPVLVVPDPESATRHVEGTLGEYMQGVAKLVNAEMRDRLPDGCEVAIDTAPLLEEASSRTTVETTVDAVDDATSPDPGGETTTGADDAEATSSPLPAGPDSAPTKPGSVDPAPTNPPTPPPPTPGPDPDLAPPEIVERLPGQKRQFTNRQKANLVRRCVREGTEVVADAEQLASGTLNRWMREFHHVVLATQESMGIAPPRGRS